MHGCTAEWHLMGATPSVPLDTPEFVDELVAFAKKLGYKVRDPKPGASSEDFSYLAQRVQAHGGKTAFFRCMSDMAAAGHAVTYDFNEKDLPNGAKFFCAAITKLMGLTE